MQGRGCPCCWNQENPSLIVGTKSVIGKTQKDALKTTLLVRLPMRPPSGNCKTERTKDKCPLACVEQRSVTRKVTALCFHKRLLLDFIPDNDLKAAHQRLPAYIDAIMPTFSKRRKTNSQRPLVCGVCGAHHCKPGKKSGVAFQQ